MDIKSAASQTDINAVLQQMRQIRDQTRVGVAAQPQEIDAARGPRSANEVGASRADFGGALKQAIDSVNSLQQTAGASATDFAAGRETNLVKVMIDSQKASVGFQAMVQVRNRMVTAYQDIMKMPI